MVNKKINHYEKFFDENDKVNINYIFKNFLYDKGFIRIHLTNLNDHKEISILIDNKNQIKIANTDKIKKILNQYISPYIEQDVVKFHNWNDFICNINKWSIRCLLEKSGGLFICFHERVKIKNKNEKMKSLYKRFFSDKKIYKGTVIHDFLPDFFNIYKFELYNAVTNYKRICFVQIMNNKIKKISFEQVKNILIEYINKYKFDLSEEQLKIWNDFIDELTERKLMYYLWNLGMISFSIYPKKRNKDLINNFNELEIDLFKNSVIIK